MEKEYNMTINRLPSKTWNWLRMNETQLEKIEIPAAGEAKVILPGMRILQGLPPVWGKIWTVCLPQRE